MPHPLYSPDLAPCDYWLKNISEEEFKKTFDKLLERMELCINNHSDYFEHLMK